MKFTAALSVLPFLLLPLSPAAAQETGTSVPSPAVPANLAAEGIPAIPPETASATSRYVEFRTASLQSWHPSHREMVIATRFADTPQLHLVRAPGGARRQLTFSREPATGASWRPVSGEFLLFSQDTGGGEFHQLHRYDPATGRTILLTDGKSRNTGPRWSKDGRLLAWTSTRRNGRDNDVWIMEPDRPAEARMPAELEGGGWAVRGWSPDGKRLLLTEYLSANLSHLWIMEAATGARERLTPADGPPVSRGGGEFSADGRFVYHTSDEGGEFQQLGRTELATRKFQPLTAEIPWDIETFALSADGRLLAFVSNEAGISRLRVIPVREEASGAATSSEAAGGTRGADLPAPFALPAIPAGVISGLEWRPGSQELGFTLSSARSPADVYSLRLPDGALERWTESETGGLNPGTFPGPQTVEVSSFDGLKVSGFLYRPDPVRFPGRRPVLISIHGGPESQSRPGFQGRNNYWMQEAGIALLYPNVRGSDGYGKTFLALDNGFKREDSVRDIGAFLDWIAADPALDADRVAVTGGSYGGYMSLACLIRYGERLRCGIDSVGISNFLTFLKNTQDYRRDLRRVEYGDERDPAMAEFLAKISPTAGASSIRRPLFVIQGLNDPRVPVTEAEQMTAAVRKNGTPVWYLMARDEGHGFAKKPNQEFQFNATALFLQEYLLK